MGVRLNDVERETVTSSSLGIEGGGLARLAEALGPFAVVDLETTGLQTDPEAEILELGAVLVDPGAETVEVLSALVRPSGAIPRAVKRLTGIDESQLGDAPTLLDVRDVFAEALRGRAIIAHNAEFERSFLGRFVDRSVGDAQYLDTLDLLALTHPDAPDLRLESFTRMLLDTEEHHRALDDALDTARVMSKAGEGAERGELRFVTARRALESYAPGSPWLALLCKPTGADAAPRPLESFVRIGKTEEAPVPFDEDAIASVLEDEARGRRHFPNYRVRAEQVELARAFVRNLGNDEVLLAEGGTGVGKSLAYLAAAIPFVMEKRELGEHTPVVVSTRTKLLQDQLTDRDIGAAARFLGHPELQAVAIKGRANYACSRRLQTALAEGREQGIFEEDRLAYAVLEACARTRPHGEIGTVPAALLRRYGPLRDLLRRSVAARAEHCTREECAKERDCPLGKLRNALGSAELIVANHDLLLRWPPDYPGFQHAIVDEVHELGDVADEAFATWVLPDAILERFDEIFGRPAAPGRKRGESLLPAGERRAFEKDAKAWRRELAADLIALGRAVAEHAGEFGEVQLPDPATVDDDRFDVAAQLAEACASRLESIADQIPEAGDSAAPLDRAVDDLRDAAYGLRLAFEDSLPDAVAAFENVLPPYENWRLVVRAVSPAEAFHEQLVSGLSSFAGVSASLFVEGDAFAALGDLELEERAGERLQRLSVPSPFDYPNHMRVVAMRGGADLVVETSLVLEIVAGELGGRTMGLFTSLRRMNEVGDELDARMRAEGIDVITPRRASDDPAALVTRFVNGAAVLLGARRFWQGIDIPGDALQAVVIEKLPFEVPTELRKRREARLRERGVHPFARYAMGRMLLNLKQMVGRLIRSETDRGVVIIVEGRSEKPYFRRLAEAVPDGCDVRVVRSTELLSVLDAVGIGPASRTAAPPDGSR